MKVHDEADHGKGRLYRNGLEEQAWCNTRQNALELHTSP